MAYVCKTRYACSSSSSSSSTKVVSKSMVPKCGNTLTLGSAQKRWKNIFTNECAIGPFTLTTKKVRDSIVFGFTNVVSSVFTPFEGQCSKKVDMTAYGAAAYTVPGGGSPNIVEYGKFFLFNIVLPSQMRAVRLQTVPMGTGLQVKYPGMYQFLYNLDIQYTTSADTTPPPTPTINIAVYDTVNLTLNIFENGVTYPATLGNVCSMNTIIPLRAGNVVGAINNVAGTTITPTYSSLFISIVRVGDYLDEWDGECSTY